MAPHGIWEDAAGGHGHSHGPSGSGSLCWRWRYVIARVLLRVAAIATIAALVRAFPGAASAAGSAVIAWLNSLPGAWSPVAFCAVATAFCAISPTGYLPAVAAGIAYAPQAAIPITYVSVNLGAAINMALVRGLCLGRLPAALRKRYEARGEALLGTGALGAALDAHPAGMVALLRLPFLANGALNYILSMRSSLPALKVALGNLAGLAPGSVLFPVAGAQIRSLGALIANGPGDGAAGQQTLGVFFGVSAAVLLAAGVAYGVTRRVLQRIAGEKAAAAEAAAPGALAVREAGDGSAESGEALTVVTAVREPEALTAAQEAEMAAAFGGK